MAYSNLKQKVKSHLMSEVGFLCVSGVSEGELTSPILDSGRFILEMDLRRDYRYHNGFSSVPLVCNWRSPSRQSV